MSLSGYSQHYECLKSGTTNFFTNGNGYLRAMRIDSVRTIGSDIVYYPFHTFRSRYQAGSLDSTGGSWLGKNVIQKSDGTFFFDNIWGDTVTIKTQANIGDSWTFFRDSTYFSYKATMLAMDTMTVLGVLDSVKKITIEADTNGVLNPSDPVNNFQIILSQHHGFEQVFDLMTFPFHRKNGASTSSGNFDYYYDLLTNSVPTGGWSYVAPPDTITALFKLIPFTIPSMMEIYDYNIGDVFESSTEHYYGGGASEVIDFDSIISKIVTAFSVSYTVASSSKQSIGGSFPTIVNCFYNTNALFEDTTKLFYLNKLPEEWRSPEYYHYFPNAHVIGTTDSCTTQVYQMDLEHIDYGNGWLIEVSDGMNSYLSSNSASYGIGYGEVGMDITDREGDPFSPDQNMHMDYAYKNGNACGTEYHIPVSVDNVQGNTRQLFVYPNPASTEIMVSSPDLIENISITNVFGQTVYTGYDRSSKVVINVSSFVPGIYYLKVNNTEVRKFVKE